jgi:hypothetical protein
LGEYLTTLQLVKIFSDFDQDRNGKVDFNEFVCGVIRYINTHQQVLEGTKEKGIEHLRLASADLEEGGEEGEGEGEEDEMPEDLAHLSPEEQQRRLKMRAAYYLAIGTTLVIIFSDPMVNVLSEIGTRTVSDSLFFPPHSPPPPHRALEPSPSHSSLLPLPPMPLS